MNINRRKIACLFIAGLFSTLVSASDRQKLFGEWGTDAQCAGTPIVPNGTKLAAPFIISDDWLGHGEVWCRLKWSGPPKTSEGLFTTAFAPCGEDVVRDYRINFRLIDNELTLNWGLGINNGPLKRCEEYSQ